MFALRCGLPSRLCGRGGRPGSFHVVARAILLQVRIHKLQRTRTARVLQEVRPPLVVVSVRRAINHWALWRSSDSIVVNTLGRRLDIKGLSDIFKDLDLGPHDHIWIDLTGNGPTLKKNITQVITINE